MPIHVVAVHLVVVLAPLTAVLALVYAAWARSRRGLRWPLVITSSATAVLVAWAGEVGGPLLASVKAHGSPAEIAAATTHAKGSDRLALAAFALLGLVLALVWWLLRPGRLPSLASRAASGLVAVGALAVLVTTWTTVASALSAVWASHPSWAA
jgi:hypothetical protein